MYNSNLNYLLMVKQLIVILLKKIFFSQLFSSHRLSWLQDAQSIYNLKKQKTL